MILTDKAVVITGGLGNLGRSVVDVLMHAGAICYLAEFVPQIPEDFPYRHDRRVHVKTGIDLSDEQAVEEFYSNITPLWGSIHLAGGFAMSPLQETSQKSFLKQMTMNATTCFLCCREASKCMTEGGRIVNVVSRQALEPRSGSGTSAYTCSKSAVLGLTLALAEELVTKNILVNAIAPSILDTPPNRLAMPDANHQEWPKVEEVAQTILFLVSPRNKVTRGAIVPVYGKV